MTAVFVVGNRVPDGQRGDHDQSPLFGVAHRRASLRRSPGSGPSPTTARGNAHGLEGFDLAFAYEALARAEQLAGRPEEVRRNVKLADEAAEKISDAEDREHVEEDLKRLRRDEGRGTR